MKSKMKTMLLGLCIAGSAGMVPSLSSAGVSIDVNIAPPAPRVEVVPAPRPGYVWAPGYWDYHGGGHVWVAGRWVGERRGYHWVPDRWEQRGPHWHREPGHWER